MCYSELTPMKPKVTTTPRAQKRPHIGENARALNVSVRYLTMLLRGERKNDNILARLHALESKQRAANPIQREMDEMERVLKAADLLRPEFDVATARAQRDAIRAKLAKVMPDDFEHIEAVVLPVFTLRQMVRYNLTLNLFAGIQQPVQKTSLDSLGFQQ